MNDLLWYWASKHGDSLIHSFMAANRGFDPETGIYHSLRQPISFPSSRTISSFVLDANISSHRPAFIHSSSGRLLSYGHLRHRVYTVASGLVHHGLRPRDVVFILSPNSIHVPVLSLATMLVGGIVSLANPLNTSQEIAKQLKDCGAKFLCTVTPLLAKVSNVRLPLILLEEESSIAPPSSSIPLSTLLQADPSLAPPFSAQQEDIAALLYSSGTTGLSKGVIITHQNLISLVSLLHAMDDDPFLQDRVYLCLLPMFHIYGLMLFLCYLPVRGCASVIMSKFDMLEMLGAIQRFKITHLPLVPPIILALTKLSIVDKYDLSSVKQVGSGAAPLSKELVVAFTKRFPGAFIKQGYGLTECTGIATLSSSEEDFKHYDSGGRLIPNTESKIVDPDTGKSLPPNQKGELFLRGPTVMRGYFGNTEATKATLDPEGWLHTGDLCYFDENGYLYIVDRLKELIKYKGLQVAPAELESVLLSHPKILDAAVIPVPDEEAGQIPMAYVVRSPKSTIKEADVIDFVSKQVAPYKKVRCVAFVDAIPKSASGKILRRELINRINSRI